MRAAAKCSCQQGSCLWCSLSLLYSLTVALYAYSSENVRLKRLPAAEVLSNERMPTTSIHTAVAISAEAIAYEDTRIPTAPLDDLPVNNPGCKSKIIRDYKPRLPGPEYYHPSIVHYVKLYHEDGVKGRLLFREFLAIMSAYKFYRPRIIILHSNADFTSDGYWNDALLWNRLFFMRFNSAVSPAMYALSRLFILLRKIQQLCFICPVNRSIIARRIITTVIRKIIRTKIQVINL